MAGFEVIIYGRFWVITEVSPAGKVLEPQPVQLPPLHPAVFVLEVAQTPFLYSGP